MDNCNVTQDFAVPFATWEVRLFLDTHPNDTEAIAAYGELCAQSGCVSNYACLPESMYDSGCWEWINNPWPWEPQANPEMEGC